MKLVDLPSHYNYIALFLTLRCNLSCDYCINKFDSFSPPDELSTDGWITGLSRLPTRLDLPISIQGGEPTIHPGFYRIADALSLKGKHLDLLTNGMFNLKEFYDNIKPNVFKRNAKYASIRMSLHSKTNNIALAMKAFLLQNNDYEVGIWAVNHPTMQEKIEEMESLCRGLNLDFRKKEFLGTYGGCMHGTYKYPEACTKLVKKRVWCRPSELLINPGGYIFRCHADLYSNRDFIGHILDNEIKFPGFTECNNYGHCNPCDVKLKTNRFQEKGYCAVEIKGEGVKVNGSN